MSVLSVERESPIRRAQIDTGPMSVLGVEAARALEDAIAPDPEAPVLVLSGRANSFCAGRDNVELAAGGVAREELPAEVSELLVSAWTSATRTVVACEGHAVATGAMCEITDPVGHPVMMMTEDDRGDPHDLRGQVQKRHQCGQCRNQFADASKILDGQSDRFPRSKEEIHRAFTRRQIRTTDRFERAVGPQLQPLARRRLNPKSESRQGARKARQPESTPRGCQSDKAMPLTQRLR